MTAGLIFALACAILAILYGIWQSTRILALPAGNERMQEISAAVREGAVAYLKRQYTTIAIVGAILFLVIGLVPQLAAAGIALPPMKRSVSRPLTIWFTCVMMTAPPATGFSKGSQ